MHDIFLADALSAQCEQIQQIMKCWMGGRCGAGRQIDISIKIGELDILKNCKIIFVLPALFLGIFRMAVLAGNEKTFETFEFPPELLKSAVPVKSIHVRAYSFSLLAILLHCADSNRVYRMSRKDLLFDLGLNFCLVEASMSLHFYYSQTTNKRRRLRNAHSSTFRWRLFTFVADFSYALFALLLLCIHFTLPSHIPSLFFN